jgi:hypothetical protein
LCVHVVLFAPSLPLPLSLFPPLPILPSLPSTPVFPVYPLSLSISPLKSLSLQRFLFWLGLLVCGQGSPMAELLRSVALVAPPAWSRKAVDESPDAAAAGAAGGAGAAAPAFTEAGSTPAGAPQSGLESVLLAWAHFVPIIHGSFEKTVRCGGALWRVGCGVASRAVPRRRFDGAV